MTKSWRPLKNYPRNTIFKVHQPLKGYSGVAILAKKSTFGEAAPSWSSGLSIDEHDQEGRVLRLDTGDFHLVNVYVPNSSSGMKRLPYRKTWDQAFQLLKNAQK